MTFEVFLRSLKSPAERIRALKKKVPGNYNKSVPQFFEVRVGKSATNP